MPKVTRISVSLEPALLKEFDRFVRERNYNKRSEAVRDVLRDYLFHKKKEKQDIVGTLRIVYDNRVNKGLSRIQNDYPCLVMSSMQVNVDHHHSMQVMVVKGKKDRIQRLIAKYRKAKGVKECELKV